LGLPIARLRTPPDEAHYKQDHYDHTDHIKYAVHGVSPKAEPSFNTKERYPTARKRHPWNFVSGRYPAAGAAHTRLTVVTLVSAPNGTESLSGADFAEPQHP
jgi:hypothetical protein